MEREAEELRIKKFRHKLKLRLQKDRLDGKHLSKAEIARRAAEEKREKYNKKIESARKDWGVAATQPPPRLSSRSSSSRPHSKRGSSSKGAGKIKAGGRNGRVARAPAGSLAMEDEIGVDLSPMRKGVIENMSTINVEVPTPINFVSPPSRARNALLKHKRDPY